jgi:hypothetical protein
MEARFKIQDDKFNQVFNEIETLRKILNDTDKHLNLYYPITILNMVTDVLHKSLEGSMFNKLIRYEKLKYLELESLITTDNPPEFAKL